MVISRIRYGNFNYDIWMCDLKVGVKEEVVGDWVPNVFVFAGIGIGAFDDIVESPNRMTWYCVLIFVEIWSGKSQTLRWINSEFQEGVAIGSKCHLFSHSLRRSVMQEIIYTNNVKKWKQDVVIWESYYTHNPNGIVSSSSLNVDLEMRGFWFYCPSQWSLIITLYARVVNLRWQFGSGISMIFDEFRWRFGYFAWHWSFPGKINAGKFIPKKIIKSAVKDIDKHFANPSTCSIIARSISTNKLVTHSLTRSWPPPHNLINRQFNI